MADPVLNKLVAAIDRRQRLLAAMDPLSLVPCGEPRFDAVTVGADYEKMIQAPANARGLMWAAMATADSNGDAVPIHAELSWVDRGLGMTLATADTVPFKLICVRDRIGVATLTDYYWAGPAGRGELLHPATEPGQFMQLYVFIEGSTLASGAGERATFMCQWGK